MCNRDELLKELNTIMHPSGRKRRKDKGKTHTYPESRSQPSKSREDKGQIRQPYGPLSPLSLYERVRSKLISLHKDLEIDENGYYVPVPAVYKTKAYDYKQKVQGREIQHTVKRVCVQNRIDLEKYRFEAWQFMALTKPFNQVTCTPEIRAMLLTRYDITLEEANRAIDARKIAWFDLFNEFYHISPDTTELWDYESWYAMYKYCPGLVLPDDFIFSLTYRPGSPEFYPEWSHHTDKLLEQEIEAIDAEKLRKKLQFINHWRYKT